MKKQIESFFNRKVEDLRKLKGNKYWVRLTGEGVEDMCFIFTVTKGEIIFP